MADSEAHRAAEGASMLLSFSAENVRSFRDPLELSLLATRRSDEEIVRHVPWREHGKPIAVLPGAGIFGANASGKSNLLRAMQDMRGCVLYSFQRGRPDGGLPTHPFLLGEDRGTAPSTYAVDVVLDGVRHEYGFRIDSKRVLEEWARSYPHGRAALLFHRRGDDVQVGSAERARGRATVDILRPNALFLSTAAATNYPPLLRLYQWFMRNLLPAEERTRPARQILTAQMLEEPEQRDRVLALLQEADLGISGARRREMDPALRERFVQALNILHGEEGESGSGDEEFEFDDFEVRLAHQAAGEEIELHPTDESLGTLIWFGLVGPVIEALRDGSVLLADELDASLHPALVEILVGLFQSQQSNPNRAQLIFNSHDVTLMGDSGTQPLGRDQIWFTEKDSDGSTRLYPLTDLSPRKEEAVARRYLAGRYGGTPIVSRRQIERIAESVASGSPD